jgi:hypothetical protein
MYVICTCYTILCKGLEHPWTWYLGLGGSGVLSWILAKQVLTDYNYLQYNSGQYKGRALHCGETNQLSEVDVETAVREKLLS